MPDLTVCVVTTGAGSRTFFLGYLPSRVSRAKPSAASPRNGGVPEDSPSTGFWPSYPSMNLRKPFSPSPPVTGSGRLAWTNAFSTPSVPPETHTPSIFGSEASAVAVAR